MIHSGYEKESNLDFLATTIVGFFPALIFGLYIVFPIVFIIFFTYIASNGNLLAGTLSIFMYLLKGIFYISIIVMTVKLILILINTIVKKITLANLLYRECWINKKIEVFNAFRKSAILAIFSYGVIPIFFKTQKIKIIPLSQFFATWHSLVLALHHH